MVIFNPFASLLLWASGWVPGSAEEKDILLLPGIEPWFFGRIP
jgi:hypothetical protein